MTRQASSNVRELARELRGMARREARAASPPVQRFKVVRGSPLVILEIGGDLRLEQGDPDVEIDRRLLTTPPNAGDTVRVHTDPDGDYIVGGVVD